VKKKGPFGDLVALKSSPGAWGTAALAKGPGTLHRSQTVFPIPPIPRPPIVQCGNTGTYCVLCSLHAALCRAVGRASRSESGSVRSNSPEAAWCPSAISQEPQNPLPVGLIRSAPLSPWLTGMRAWTTSSLLFPRVRTGLEAHSGFCTSPYSVGHSPNLRGTMALKHHH
jgi:hypothetical protein